MKAGVVYFSEKIRKRLRAVVAKLFDDASPVEFFVAPTHAARLDLEEIGGW
jgi:hypothetical protein